MRIVEKISVVFILLYVTNFARFISNLLNRDLPIEEIFWVLPCITIYVLAYTNKRLKFPHFILFLIIAVWFAVNESNLIRTNIDSNYAYVIDLAKFYSFIVALYSLGLEKQKGIFILKASITVVLIYVSFFYLIYFNFLNIDSVQEDIVLTEDNEGRMNVGNMISINAVSLVASFGVLCTLVLSIVKAQKLNLKSISVILFFIGIILLHATRGAFLISILLLVTYFYYNFKTYNAAQKSFIIVSLGLSIFLFIALSSDLLTEVLVIKRFVDETEITSGREQQIMASWYNFLEKPYWGWGYNLAAFNKELNTVRANFHFTQVLASAGIFWSILYFYFLYALFFKNNFKGFLLFFPIFIFISFSSYNWSEIMCISIIYYFNIYLRRNEKTTIISSGR